MAIWDIFVILVSLVFLAFFIALYIYYCNRIVKMARELGVNKDHLWLAYIPIVQGFVLCKMAGSNMWTFIIPVTFPFWILLSEFFSVFYGFYLITIISFGVVSLIWGWKICKKFNYSGWWTIIFSIWVLFMETNTEQKADKDKEKKEIEYYAKHKETIEKQDNKEFLQFLKIIGLVIGLILLVLLVRIFLLR
ncbi:MAG: hypothetical protein Q7S74_05375 [Nanoarchaeota archaeon]|nr:hypothetical protein [Nanoarchaeota archaeon]